jgi:hypothetical protein
MAALRLGDAPSAQEMHNLRAFICEPPRATTLLCAPKRVLSKWVQKRGKELRFEINGQLFFVNFVPEEGRWYCYAPTAAGMQKIPVSMDTTPFDSFTMQQDEQAKEVVN